MPGEQTDVLAPLTVFYSYAHEDEALRGKLEDHLRSLQAQGLISAWHDRQIVAGTEWAYEIDSRLRTASIILLLISPAFMASDYCVGIEMQQAMERHHLGDATVIPIILEPTAWQDAPFAILQCLPRGAKPVTAWDDPEDAFEDVAQGVRYAVEEMSRLYTGGPHLPSAPIMLASDRQRMLKCVRELWITGLLKESLNEATLLTLGLHEQPDAVANPWSSSFQEMNRPARPLRLGTRIIQAYDDAQGGLLILGEPGSGKTTLLLSLTRDLIKRAERYETHPIPVVFTLSSWSLKQQPIADWLVEELFFKYQVARKLARQWVDNEQVLPLLDGLDEVAPNHRAACIEAVNTYKQAHGLLPMVICSRSADYLAQQSRVLLRTAIVVQPLTPAQIELYLASAKQQLAPVRAALQADTELQELASTPLMLSVLALAYHGSSMNDLLAISSPLARRQQIFATYVQRMFQRRGAKIRYTAEQTIEWLTWLAQQMQQQHVTELYLEQFQLGWLPTRQRKLYRWSDKLLSVLALWLFVGLFIWLLGGLFAGLHGQLTLCQGYGRHKQCDGLPLWLLFGPIFGMLSYALLFDKNDKNREVKPAEILPWSWKTFLFGPIVGLLFGPIMGIGFGAMGGLRAGLASGLLIGLFGGMFGGLGSTFSGQQLTKRFKHSPNEGIHRSLKNGLLLFAGCLLFGLVSGLLVGLLSGLLFKLADGLGFGLRVGLGSGLDGGLLVGLLFGLGAAVRHYTLRIWLWQAGCTPVPWHYVPFLDYAAERILLRKVGGGYIFMHRLLLDYFASSAPGERTVPRL